MANGSANVVRFPEGDHLTGPDAERIVRASPTCVVVVAGAADSGKTTLVADLYGLFQRGPFAGLLFAGSQTLPGFEKRCHLARIASGGTKPDTERTKHADSHHLLHLRLAEAQPLRHHDVLFSDIYGEAFRRAADSADECKTLSILKRADHVAVLVDGKRAILPAHRQEAFASADALVSQCLDCQMLGPASSVQVVMTKWDAVAVADPARVAFVEAKLRWLLERHGKRLGGLKPFRVAIRPDTETDAIKAGYGVGELLHQWLSDAPRPRAAVPVSNAYHTEFDRMAGQRSEPVRSEVAEGD